MTAPSPEPGSLCEGCGRRIPIPKEDKTPRKRAQKNISVPADQAENGVEVLDGLVFAAATKPSFGGELGYDAETPPYTVICAALAYVVQFT